MTFTHKQLENFFKGICPDCSGCLEHDDFYEMKLDSYYHSMDKYICGDCGVEIADFYSDDPVVEDNGLNYCG